ncbi:hypothetical protein PAECIP111894_02220 [Paenibacillus pseudetheri]|uniref:Peptidase S33 tripeptidyl aminopeptidase-like C-terminal domain-containing protein n=1 Tax=Paenibacillus pseudetheri TaxID=2897682 RepID=A0ABM9BBG5_9BACL|nr:hypothetical protein PAECIP111894_02220 [Paenibacillus pseudetheri]
MFNHAFLTGVDDYEGKAKNIMVSTLVIHGTADTVLPLEHGLALANDIPNTSLLTLEGTGHEVHPDDWEIIINVISSHTLGGNA